MTTIEKLAEYIEEEIDDACKYAKCAIANKHDDKLLAEMYYTIAKEELHHAAMEEEHIDRLMKDADADGEWMKICWKWQRNKLIDRKANVNAMLTMYKEKE